METENNMGSKISGRIYIHVANLTTVQSPLDCIHASIESRLGIKHTELV